MPTSYYAKCHACGRAWHSPTPRRDLLAHQARYHEEAQTVWTRDEEQAALRDRRHKGTDTQ